MAACRSKDEECVRCGRCWSVDGVCRTACQGGQTEAAQLSFSQQVHSPVGWSGGDKEPGEAEETRNQLKSRVDALETDKSNLSYQLDDEKRLMVFLSVFHGFEETFSKCLSYILSSAVIKVGRNWVPGPHKIVTLRSLVPNLLNSCPELWFSAAETLFQGLESWHSVSDWSLLVHYTYLYYHYRCVSRFICVFLPTLPQSE